MPKFKKIVVSPGLYQAPEGNVHITPERLRSWVEKFRHMRDDRIRIPAPWGHLSVANPVVLSSAEDEAEFQKNRWNATFVDDLEIGPNGDLIMVGDVPPGMTLDETGDVVDPVNHTKIGEVSAAICDWRDGKGRLWPDAIRHIALTVLPVAHGTGGFSPIETNPPPVGEVRFSLSTCVYRFATGERSMPDVDKLENENDQDMGGPSPGMKDPIISPGGAKDDEGLTSQLIDMLSRCGVALPPDTDVSNFQERLFVALHAMEAREGGGAEEEEMPPEESPPPEEPPQNGAQDGPLKEEPMPAFMSLSNARTPLERVLLARMADDSRAKRRARIDALEKVTIGHGIPWLKPAQVQQLRMTATGSQFSLAPSGESVELEIDRQLALLESLAPAAELSLRGSSEEEPPYGSSHGDRRRQEEAGDELAALAGVRIKAK